MYAISLGDDAELRPLEPWHAEEFLAHLERGREFIGQYIPFGTTETDPVSARAKLQRYADMRAADTGSLHGLWLDGTLVGGVLFLNFDAAAGTCEVGCWLEPGGTGRGLVTRRCASSSTGRSRSAASTVSSGSPPRATSPASTWPGASA
jgi:ribosomal-protein-serine acetyltransferase